ncbi:MAG: prepilin-type N-terminal cleavage/methylation domain-containing protein [Gemmataceae bacterium]
MRYTTQRPRRGFSLVEILVVLSIIAILASLSMAAYMRIRTLQNVRTSEDVVSKVQLGLDNQVKIIADNVRLDKASPEYVGLLPFCDNDPDRTTSLLLYCRLRQAFPSPSDIALPAPTPVIFTVNAIPFRRPVAFDRIAGASDPDPNKISAAILFVALSARTQGGNTLAVDEGLAGAQLDLPVQSGGTVRVFKDGFGNPVPFVRFLESTELDTDPRFTNLKSGNKDPFDVWGKLNGWTNAANKGSAQTSVGVAFNGRNKAITAFSYGQNKTPDPILGTLDDIMGYRLRAVGQKGANP